MLENLAEIDRLQRLLVESWLDQLDAVGARIAAEKMFTFSAGS